MIDWNILLYQHRKGRRQGPNQSPRVLCRAGGPHNPVLPGQVADMETMRPLLAQTDKKTAVTLDRSRLLYLINVHYNGQRDTPSRSEPLSCFTMIQFGMQAADWTSMSKAQEKRGQPGMLPSCLHIVGILDHLGHIARRGNEYWNEYLIEDVDVKKEGSSLSLTACL